MELLDRYLEAVKKQLPWQRQDDIVAELRANLESQLEEKEAALGRPLTKAEAEAWIKQLASPMQMAAPYQPQHYLIGPAIFPIYRHVLKLALSWAVVIYAISSVVRFIAGEQPDSSALLAAFFHIPALIVGVLTWCTLVFAAIEYAVLHGWVKLPQLEHASGLWSPSFLPALEEPAPGKKPRSFAQAVAEVVIGFFLLDWLLLIPHHPWVLMGPGADLLTASPYQLAPIWWQFYWCIVALNIVQLGWNLEGLLRGRWRRPQPMKKAVFKIMGLIPLAVVLTVRDHALIVLKHPVLDQTRYGSTLEVINIWAYRSFLIIAAIASIQLAWDLGRMSINGYRKHAARIR